MENIQIEVRDAINSRFVNIISAPHPDHNFGVINLDSIGLGLDTRAAAFSQRLIGILSVGQQASKEHLAKEMQRLKGNFADDLSNANFRRSVKSFLTQWALLQAQLQSLDYHSTDWLVRWTLWVCDLVLSPIGDPPSEELLLVLENHLVPLRFSQSIEWPTEESDWIKCYSKLPDFLGLFDLLDPTDSDAVVQMLPESFVEPGWYSDERNDIDTDYTDDGAGVFETLFQDRFLLRATHRVKIDDGFCKYIDLTPLQGLSAVDGWYTGLAAAITYEDNLGGDIYLVLQSQHVCLHSLLIGIEKDFGTGPSVILRVYKAVAAAIWEETGQLVEIDEVREELGEL